MKKTEDENERIGKAVKTRSLSKRKITIDVALQFWAILFVRKRRNQKEILLKRSVRKEAVQVKVPDVCNEFSSKTVEPSCQYRKLA